MDNSENELTERKETKRAKPQSSLRNALIAYGESEDFITGKSHAALLAEVAWERAMAGNLDWVHFVRDTMIGKPAQSVELGTVDGSGPISLSLINFSNALPPGVAHIGEPKRDPIDITPERDSAPDTTLGDLI